MGYYLSTGWYGPYVLCNCYAWGLLFRLALEYGWEPLGTIRLCWHDPVDEQGAPISDVQEAPTREDYGEDGDECYRSYFYNDGQLVDSDDCKAMLLALESARSDIAKGNLRKGTCAEKFNSEKGLALLDKMIVVCKKGFFFIF